MTPRLPLRCLALLLLGSVATLACASQGNATQDLEGAWELVSGEYVDAQGQAVDYASTRLEGMKVIQDGHFAFTTTQAGRFWAGGAGTFEADGSHYVETPGMASYPLVEGGRYRFSYVLEGDRWTLERHEDGKRVEREVWRRVDAAR